MAVLVAFLLGPPVGSPGLPYLYVTEGEQPAAFDVDFECRSLVVPDVLG